MKWSAALVVAASLLGGGSAAAQEAPRFVVDVYDPIGGCPDEAAFRSEVERRVHAWPRAQMHVAVHVTQQPRIIEGTVDVIDASGARATRKVSSTHCAEIVSAAALVTALVIDDAAEAAGGTTVTAAPPSPNEQVTPVVAPMTLNGSDAGPVVRSDDLVFRAGVDGAVQVGVVPNPVVSMPIFVELGDERRFPGFHLEPRARLSWTFATPSDGESAGGRAHFSWMSGALDVCPVRLALATRGTVPFLDLRACGRFEVGRLSADGLGTLTNRVSDNRVWLGAGVPVTGRFEVGQRFFLEAEVGPRFGLVRDRFYVGPANSLVFQPNVVGLAAGFGAGVSFR